MIQIRFIAQGSNTAIGGFSSGDVARISPALAKHLVEDARVAVYVEATVEPAIPFVSAKPARRQTKPREA